MGCMESRPDINDLHANIFQVVNADDQGHRSRSAKLEVTESHLVLHQRSKTPITWPLRGLRRYGFDGELFSFESGRRCPTGPGIYTFRCRRAEALFNMVQLQIQNITTDAQMPFLIADVEAHSLEPLMDSQDYLEPMSQARSMATTFPVVGGGVASSFTGSPATPPTPLSPPPNVFYINSNSGVPNIPSSRLDERISVHVPDTPITDPPETPLGSIVDACSAMPERNVFFPNIPEHTMSSLSTEKPVNSRPSSSESDRPLSYANIDSSFTYEGNSSYLKLQEVATDKHLYVNVMPEPRRGSRRDHVYENLGPEKEIPVVPPKPAGMNSVAGASYTDAPSENDKELPEINYITVDIDKNVELSVAAPPLSPLGTTQVSSASSMTSYPTPEGYAKIDFTKTQALSNTAKKAATREQNESVRRMRKNSTLSAAPRNNNSLSD